MVAQIEHHLIFRGWRDGREPGLHQLLLRYRDDAKHEE